MNKEHFDVDRIVSIFFKPEHTNKSYYWVDSKPIKKLFGLINTGLFSQAGWVDRSDWDNVIYTDDELRKYGYKVYSTDERINDHRVCNKAYVKVYLTHDNTIQQTFESDQKAEEWIELLKSTSGKTFEIAFYN